jgi:hypothetical protein
MATFDTRKGQNVDIRHNLREKFTMIITVTDQDSAAVDLSAKTLLFSIRETESGTAVDTMGTAEGTITVSGASNNVLTFSKTLTLSQKNYYYDLLNSTDTENIMDGRFYADYTAR